MGWLISRFTSSVLSLLGSSAPSALTAEPHRDIEDIRECMLALLEGISSPTITRRIRYTLDIQGLWYLRGDLMSVLASRHGEAIAREKIRDITAMFQDMLPSGLKARPSPLGAPSKHLPHNSAD